MEKPLVSIAICTYNGEKFLKEQLDSIVNQTYPNIEIIVVDDQSSDKTPEILKLFEVSYKNIFVHENESNLGYIKNFEKAISLCHGEYIALSDQDDIWSLNKIELQVNFIQDNLMVYHDSELVNEDGSSLNKKMTDFRNFYNGNDSRYLLLENCVSGHSIFFKRQLINYLLPFPNEIFHDWWIAFVATNHGNINFQDKSLVKYRQHLSTSTDIQQKKKSNSKKRLERLVDLEKQLTVFNDYHSNKHRSFTSRLLKLLQEHTYALSLFVWKHRLVLLFIQKKNSWSKFNFCRKLRT